MQSFIDSSFASFINTAQTMENEEIPYEIIFKNEALMNIINEKQEKSLATFIDKPCFVNEEFKTQMSLVSVVQGRFSDEMLNQVYQFDKDVLLND